MFILVINKFFFVKEREKKIKRKLEMVEEKVMKTENARNGIGGGNKNKK